MALLKLLQGTFLFHSARVSHLRPSAAASKHAVPGPEAEFYCTPSCVRVRVGVMNPCRRGQPGGV